MILKHWINNTGLLRWEICTCPCVHIPSLRLASLALYSLSWGNCEDAILCQGEIAGRRPIGSGTNVSRNCNEVRHCAVIFLFKSLWASQGYLAVYAKLKAVFFQIIDDLSQIVYYFKTIKRKTIIFEIKSLL